MSPSQVVATVIAGVVLVAAVGAVVMYGIRQTRSHVREDTRRRVERTSAALERIAERKRNGG